MATIAINSAIRALLAKAHLSRLQRRESAVLSAMLIDDGEQVAREIAEIFGPPPAPKHHRPSAPFRDGLMLCFAQDQGY